MTSSAIVCRWVIGLSCLWAGVSAVRARAAEAGKPLEVLYITGGCCHDYDGQKKVITQGMASRARINCTVVHEGGTTTDHKVSIYSKPDWSKGYDVQVRRHHVAWPRSPL